MLTDRNRYQFHWQGVFQPRSPLEFIGFAVRIFRQSDYRDAAIGVDITGGTKLMSVAIAMACIPAGRRMQYMDADRDWQGMPLEQGEIAPVGIDVGPLLYGGGG